MVGIFQISELNQTQLWNIKNILVRISYNTYLRRIIAIFLLTLGILQLWINYHKSETTVLIARTTLYPGVPITAAMISTRKLPSSQLPQSLLTNLSAIEHKYVVIPIQPGDFISSSQLLDHIQAEHYLPVETHPRIVPITIHDPALVHAINPGQIVDIISKASDQSTEKHGKILAQHAIIVTVVAIEPDHNSGESIVYMALTQADAQKTAESTAELGFIFH